MPNNQRHRGQHSDDVKNFNEKWILTLRKAVMDLSFLLSNGYSENSSIKLVGDRYRLNARQRQALRRASCADESRLLRTRRQVEAEVLKGEEVAVDGYNLLIITEVALSNGIILACRDECYRDIASIHGTYKRVAETMTAIQIIGDTIQKLGIKQANWFLDSPVSNSGRLKVLLLEEAEKQGWNWEVTLVHNPDKEVAETGQIAISSDGWVIDHSPSWFNMFGYMLEHKLLEANLKVLG